MSYSYYDISKVLQAGRPQGKYLPYVLYNNCIMDFKLKVKVLLLRNTHFTRARTRLWLSETFYCGNDFYIIKQCI